MPDNIVEEIEKLGENVQKTHEDLNRTFETLKGDLERAKKEDDALLNSKIETMKEAMVTHQQALDEKMAKVEAASKRTRIEESFKSDEAEFKSARAFQTISKQRQNKLAVGQMIKDEDVNVDEYRAYKEAFDLMLRKDERVLDGATIKALSVGSDPDGGYTVYPELSARIIARQFETSMIREVATVETIGSNSLDILEDPDEFAASWVAETETSANSDTAELGRRNIPVHELEARPRATQTLLDDSNINMEAWLSRKLANKFSRSENNAFVVGDGVGKPRGMTTYANGTTWGTVEQVDSGANGSATYAGLTGIVYSLEEHYHSSASWLLHRTLVGSIAGLTATSQPLWIPSIAVGIPSTLLGHPVRMATDFATPATDSLSGAFGDFKEFYTIVDRIGMRVIRDPYTAKPFVEFYTNKKVGADVGSFFAAKIIKLAA